MRTNVVSLVALAATAAALVVTSPRMGERIDPDMPLTIKWQSVSTDPDTFNIELVNQNVYPPTTEIVARDVDSSTGSYTIDAKTFPNVDTGKGYQINMLSRSNGILAQSEQFRVTEPGALASSSGKETSSALETSSISASSTLLSSTASTSDLTSSTLASSTTASSSMSSTAHSSTNIHNIYPYNILFRDRGIHHDAYLPHFFLSLININTLNFFFHNHNLSYPDHILLFNNLYIHVHTFFYLNYHLQIHSNLDFHIKHYLFYQTTHYHLSFFYPHFHHACDDQDFDHNFDQHLHLDPFHYHCNHHPSLNFDFHLDGD
ncbi:uncharacterized protein N7515_005633 [Penicillium bovifimosum]|uniref:Yeast cell wall synthesis Kre9/Knh1-like N-terminal domain-containing protein n=1 Tax=Penicillium bovifimosum TaxID=126998 RepID=A0A9W9GUQ3_9EURO|nr:uncharacterized protein N7515_005633 [Penicillium bovifimosum]KAJ5129594.1 hypothetical protein N7515_005633 [Penicillium bovifimosum]